MKTNLPQSKARLFGRAGESVTRSDRRQPELEFGSSLPPLTARPNRRRDDVFGWRVKASPLEGAPNECKTGGEILTPVGHPFISDSERRFAPTTVRQDRNGVRHGLEQVSAFIGIRKELDFFTACEKLDFSTAERLLRSGFDPNKENDFAYALSRVKAKPLIGFYKNHRAEFPVLDDQAAIALRIAVGNKDVRWAALLVWAGATHSAWHRTILKSSSRSKRKNAIGQPQRRMPLGAVTRSC